MNTLKWHGNKYHFFIVNYYYLLVVFIYIFSIYIPVIRTGVTMSLILLYLFTSCRVVRFASKLSGLVFLFLIYCVFSIQGYFYNGIPFSSYFTEIPTQVFPIIFFFIPFNQNINRERFYKTFVIAITIAIILGLYYYIFNPTVYIQYMLKVVSESYEGGIGVTIQRFNSIFGSTIMGSFSVFVMIILMYRFWDRKTRSSSNLPLYLLLYTLAFLSAILTMQRSSIVLAFFCVIFIYICSIVFRNKISTSFTLFNILLYFILTTIIVVMFQEYFDFFLERLDSMDTVFDERSNQWTETFEHSPNMILGTGLGSAGHKALAFTRYHITDGALFKITAEFGIIGIILFLYIIAKCMIIKIKYFPELFREYLIIFVCLVQSIGSNTLVFQQVLPIFWFSLGSVANYYKTKSL